VVIHGDVISILGNKYLETVVMSLYKNDASSFYLPTEVRSKGLGVSFYGKSKKNYNLLKKEVIIGMLPHLKQSYNNLKFETNKVTIALFRFLHQQPKMAAGEICGNGIFH
jgi:hypothetical protein